MIALDTNVLVRFLVRDDAAQARRAKALVDRLTEREERAHVSDVVLCELVWVLGRSYGLARADVAFALASLVQSKQLSFDSVDHVLRALAAYEVGRGDFADYLVREHARAAGCETVMTFDQALLSEEAFASP
jgi:predicted nucleic-acid-binding protein